MHTFMIVIHNMDIYDFLWKDDNMKVIDTIALVLVIIGAINWGLIGIFNFNLVDAIFGTMSVISRIIYTEVGIEG